MRCEHDHEWSASITNLIDGGRGCPKCSGMYHHSEAERIAQLDELPGKKFVRWVEAYRNNMSKAVMRCKQGHEWAAAVSDLICGGYGCPKCAGNTPYSAEERIAQLNALPGRVFIRWVDIYRNQKSKAVVRCDRGHELSACVGALIRAKECSLCVGNYRRDAGVRERQLNDLPNMTFVRWLDSHENDHSKAVMRCDVDGHEWATTVNSLLRGSRCPKCFGSPRYSSDEREAQLNSLHGKRFVRWVDGYRNKQDKVVMRCECGLDWVTTVHNMLNNGSGCPSCAKSGYDPSKPGTLYALRDAEGTHIKIGISNTYKRRLAELRRATPFDFEPIHIHHCDDGSVIRDLEKMFHANFESSGFTKFDGATEWLKFDPQILSLLRILGA